MAQKRRFGHHAIRRHTCPWSSTLQKFPLLLSTFPLFVPSLSWQMVVVFHKMKLKADRFAYLLRPSGEKGFGTIVAFVPFAPMTTFVCASPPQVRNTRVSL